MGHNKHNSTLSKLGFLSRLFSRPSQQPESTPPPPLPATVQTEPPPDLRSDPDTVVTQADSFDQLLSQLQMATAALDELGGGPDVQRSENAVDLPLHVILSLLPEHYIVAAELDNVRLRDVSDIEIVDLYPQLAGGQVTANVATLVQNLPARVVLAEAYQDTGMIVTLPLKDVVHSLGPEAFRNKTPGQTKKFNISNLPDPFPESALVGAEADLAAAPANAAEVMQPPSPEASAAPVTAQQPAPEEKPARGPILRRKEPTPEAPPPREASPAVGKSGSAGVNLNTATTELLMSIDGVDAKTANAIMLYREEHGAFIDIFQLAAVPGMNRQMFRTLTGMPLSSQGRRRHASLAALLGIAEKYVEDIPLVARTIAQGGSHTGCLISNRSGKVLARAGQISNADTLAGAIPGLLSALHNNTSDLSRKRPRFVSIDMDGNTYMIAAHEKIYISLVQPVTAEEKRWRKDLPRIAKELAWVMSHRAYVPLSES